MHPCVCIWFTAFCLATGAPLLCSLRHAQLVPYRPWAETNELNPPPKRTRLERPARTFGKWHQRMVLVGFSACKLEPSFRKHLKPFVPSCWGSRCQVGHLQTHSALVVGMGMWWAILISGSMKTCLHSMYRFSEVTIAFVSMWVGTWLFWNEFNNGSSLGMNHLIAFRCFGLVVENQ